MAYHVGKCFVAFSLSIIDHRVNESFLFHLSCLLLGFLLLLNKGEDLAWVGKEALLLFSGHPPFVSTVQPKNIKKDQILFFTSMGIEKLWVVTTAYSLGFGGHC